MERKDYLKEGLSKEEKIYLKKMILNVRRLYIKENYDFINPKDLCWDTCEDIEGESVLETVLNKCVDEIVSAMEFEKVICDEKLYNIIKALSLREKMVLFSLYKEGKTIKQISKEMNISEKTISRSKTNAHKQIIKKLLGGEKNV